MRGWGHSLCPLIISDIIYIERRRNMTNSKEQNAEEILPAMLQQGESLIPEELANKYTKFVEDLKNKENVEKMIKSEKKPPANTKSTSVKSVAEDAIGSSSAEKTQKDKAPVSKTGKVTTAIYSSKNVNWQGVGKVVKGFNIVSHAEAEKWLTRKHVRVATPEEVAAEYGV
jgi:predicted nucleic acid-binding protein